MNKAIWHLGWIFLGLTAFAASAWGETTYDKTIWPLKFSDIDVSETDAQVEKWNLLLKYKLFATGLDDGTGIVFKGQNIFITDEVGYSGSATGDFVMGGNTRHKLGGPVLFGGKFRNGDGSDTISTGPTRFLGKFDPSSNGSGSNYFSGYFCLDGGYTNATTSPGLKAGDGTLLSAANCETEEFVPFVDKTLDVPVLSSDVSPVYQSAIYADGTTKYIFVPPYTETDSASFNFYVESINFSNNGKLYVVMPPGGRLTKVFLNGSISGLGSTANNDIVVAYANSEAGWNSANSTWDVSAITPVSNSDYAGNLLFYTPNDLSMGAGQKLMQGTYISGGTISFAQNSTFAGQLLAKAIYIDADFSAKDFRYVPFDPPILNLDPTALASGKFQENDLQQEVPVHLDTTSTTDVMFNYCFVLSSADDANADLLANANDFDVTGMPICTVNADGTVSGDSGKVLIEAGSKVPTVKTKVTVTVKSDGRVEGDESFKLYVFNMSGAVLPGNKRTGYFTLIIKDADDNLPPAFAEDSYAFDVDENSAANTLVGTVVAEDQNTGDVVIYRIASGDSNLFALDSLTGKITLKKNVLDYESKDTTFTLYIYATDGQANSDTVPVTLHVKDVNETPSLADTTFSVAENSAKGDTVGTLVGFDPDSLNASFSTLTYKLIGSSDVFCVLATGEITVKGALDYETVKSYTIRVQVSDGTYSDTADVLVKILDVNEPPSVEGAVVTIPEDCAGCSANEKIAASDPDGDKLVYKIVNDTSSIFSIDSSTGLISLQKGTSLDYEKDSVYTVKVSVTDPHGLSDTATVTVKVLNGTEKVEITQAESGDSTWTNPDTIYTNNSRGDITYTTPEGTKDTTVSLKEGKNVIVVRFQDGTDTLVVYLNTKVPLVTVTASNDSAGRVSGVTIVEQMDEKDSSSYVRSNDPVISVTVTDRSGETAKTVTTQVSVHLDTVSVPKTKIAEAEKTIGKVTLADESDLSSSVEVSHRVVGEDKIRVSYKDTTASGAVVTVSYYTDSEGNRLVDANGEEYYEVSTVFKRADGTEVTLTYTVDAMGTVATDADGKTLYTVTYETASSSDAATGGSYRVTVSYTMNSSGKVSLDESGNVPYAVQYFYTDAYGNSAFAETRVVVDTIPPKVKILSPENGIVVSNVSIEVIWTVDDIEQDTLNFQGLNDGKNQIIRTYRDKAGNEASDTVMVILKSGKLIEVSVADPLVAPDAKTVEKFTAASNSEPGTSYALSVYNAKTGKEEETQAGSTSGVSEGSHKEPYEGLSGKHLGVTLEITAQAPAIDETGTLSTLESIVENGNIALDSGGGWDRTMTTVEDYVENYCSAEFRRAYDSIGTAASLYTTKVSIKIWLFTTIGDFVDDYSFTQYITPDYVDKTGGIQMYFELKPDGDGYLKNSDGRLLGTGAYIYNTEVKIRSQLQCELPDHKRGYIRKDDDRILTKWGYRRPDNK